MYNQGCTALQQADFAAAKEAFNAAATYNDQADDGNGDDHDFAARCASGAACVGFNLARSHLQAQKLQEASAEIEAAYSQGQKAARLKPEDEQIAQNLHHIKMLRKRILQLMKEQQQQQQQDQQNQQQEQNQENQNQQNQQQKKNQEQQQEQQQDQQNQENQEQQEQQDQASEEKEPEEKASQEQAQLDRELQRLIDNEKMRRLQKRREQSRQMPVEKDW
jgi:Ca-activated chloride channel family protein